MPMEMASAPSVIRLAERPVAHIPMKATRKARGTVERMMNVERTSPMKRYRTSSTSTAPKASELVTVPTAFSTSVPCE